MSVLREGSYPETIKPILITFIKSLLFLLCLSPILRLSISPPPLQHTWPSPVKPSKSCEGEDVHQRLVDTLFFSSARQTTVWRAEDLDKERCRWGGLRVWRRRCLNLGRRSWRTMLVTLWGTYRSKYEHLCIGVLPVKGRRECYMRLCYIHCVLTESGEYCAILFCINEYNLKEIYRTCEIIQYIIL